MAGEVEQRKSPGGSNGGLTAGRRITGTVPDMREPLAARGEAQGAHHNRASRTGGDPRPGREISGKGRSLSAETVHSRVRHDGQMTTLGLVFVPSLPPERLKSVALLAEEHGLDELWLWEDCFMESGIASAAAALAWTGRLTVGIGLLPVPLRNVALTAMEAATIDRLFPGRIRLGVGHGVQEWMGQVGVRAESPMTLLREYVVALRQLLAGDRVTTQGRYVHLDGVALDWPPSAPVPIHVGAVGPRTLRLSGEVGDGTILTMGVSPDELRAALVEVDAGRAAGARTGPHPVTISVLAATGPDAEERLHRDYARWEVDPTKDVGVAGDAEAVAAAVRRWADAGATTVVIQPTMDEPDIEGFLRFVTTEVRPLL